MNMPDLNNKRILHYLNKCLTLTLILIIIYQQMTQAQTKYIYIQGPLKKSENIKEKPFQVNFEPNKIDLFKTLGIKYKNDKVSYHHYENMYGTLMAHLTDKKFNLLEIGLGHGTSIPLWREYFPNATYSLLEYDAKRVESFRSKVDNLFLGDQSDLDLLRIVGTSAGPFQVVVDDGGHSRKQQVNSLVGLWPFVQKNGGIYVIEDFYYSFSKSPNYYDSNESSFDLISQLIILFNDPTEIEHLHGSKVIYPDMKIRGHAREISKELMSIHCYKRACVLVKK